jgi:LmbE family N-acetylglucosaminyl deacetylase
MSDGSANRLGTILGVWAHPDDETWLSAVHMLRAVRAGDRVVCVTATRGELGSTDPERWPAGDQLATARTAELETALGVLGVKEHHWLDYADGGVPDVPSDEGVGRVLGFLRDVRPDTVLTFGPDGMTGHDDHVTVSRWVDEAVAQLDPQERPQVLWATNRQEWLDRWHPELEALGVYMGAQPPVTPEAQMRSHIEHDDEERDLKYRALTSQVSQIEPLVQAFGPDRFREALSEESFR